MTRLIAAILFTSVICISGSGLALAEKKGGGKAVPGPIAGASLPFLLAAGAAGIYKIRRRDGGQ